MKITILDCSPKFKGSQSNYLITQIKKSWGDKHTYYDCKLIQKSNWDRYNNYTIDSDVILLVSPLYVDGLPSHTINYLYELDKFLKNKKFNFTVYSIINCGMYEAIQNKVAISIVKNWCERVGAIYGTGLGIGSGPLVATTIFAPNMRKSRKNVCLSIERLSSIIDKRSTSEDIYVTSVAKRKLCIFLGNMYFYVLGLGEKTKPWDIKKQV